MGVSGLWPLVALLEYQAERGQEHNPAAAVPGRIQLGAPRTRSLPSKGKLSKLSVLISSDVLTSYALHSSSQNKENPLQVCNPIHFMSSRSPADEQYGAVAALCGFGRCGLTPGLYALTSLVPRPCPRKGDPFVPLFGSAKRVSLVSSPGDSRLGTRQSGAGCGTPRARLVVAFRAKRGPWRPPAWSLEPPVATPARRGRAIQESYYARASQGPSSSVLASRFGILCHCWSIGGARHSAARLWLRGGPGRPGRLSQTLTAT